MHRSISALALFAMALAAPASGRSDNAERIEIDLSSFKYTPSTITLTHGRSYLLHFVNQSGGGHDFVARSFFADATIEPGDRPLVGKGEIDLQGGETKDIHLIVPTPGRYEAHCSHFMHSTFGMKASIVVI